MIIFPMLGNSSRFFERGYIEPKFKLPLWGRSVFYYCVKSFRKYFNSDLFVFIVRANFYNSAEFVRIQAQLLGIKFFQVIEIDAVSRGQAETILLALQRLNLERDEELFIFNIDTICQKFEKKENLEKLDGYIEVFVGEGDHWSFIQVDHSGAVSLVAEKKRISSMCSDGLYYFKSSSTYERMAKKAIYEGLMVSGEFYIAPLYNQMISEKLQIGHKLIPRENLFFCGTPIEYESLLDHYVEPPYFSA